MANELVITRIYSQACEAELCSGILSWLSTCCGLFSRMRWWRLSFRESGWSWPGWAAEGNWISALRQSLPWCVHWGMNNSGSRTAVLWMGIQVSLSFKCLGKCKKLGPDHLEMLRNLLSSAAFKEYRRQHLLVWVSPASLQGGGLLAVTWDVLQSFVSDFAVSTLWF